MIPTTLRTPITVPFFCFPMIEGKMNWIDNKIRKIMTRISIIRMSITKLLTFNRQSSMRKEFRFTIMKKK